MICHAGEQVTLSFVGLRKRHAVGLGKLVQQVAALQVLIAELLHLTAMQEACAVDAPIHTVTGADRLQHAAILSVGVAGGASEGIA